MGEYGTELVGKLFDIRLPTLVCSSNHVQVAPGIVRQVQTLVVQDLLPPDLVARVSMRDESVRREQSRLNVNCLPLSIVWCSFALFPRTLFVTATFVISTVTASLAAILKGFFGLVPAHNEHKRCQPLLVTQPYPQTASTL